MLVTDANTRVLTQIDAHWRLSYFTTRTSKFNGTDSFDSFEPFLAFARKTDDQLIKQPPLSNQLF